MILSGRKDVENRTWSTRFRGALLVHAGARIEWRALPEIERRFGIAFSSSYRPTTGAILGMVEIVDCVTDHESPFFDGPYGLVIERPLAFPRPIPFRGRLGIFQVPAHALQGTPAMAMPRGTSARR